MAIPSNATARTDFQNIYNSLVTLETNTNLGGSTRDDDVYQIAKQLRQTIETQYKSQFLRITGRDL